MSDEFSRIAKYFAPLAGPEGLALKDDTAVFTPPPDRELVITADQMLQGVHFLPGDRPDLIARKLLRRNLSDLAAMGAVPLGYLLTTALPPDVSEAWLAEFAEGLRQDQEEYGLSLFGGDSSSSLSHISLSVTMLGHVAPGAALRRNGAQAGDEIWVTGAIGDAALGLQARRGILRDGSGYLTQRSLLPSPRMGLALAGIATAAIDISDGLVQDLQHICQESAVAAEISASLVPVSPQAAVFGDAVLETRLTGGDDYELLLAVPPPNAEALRNVCAALPITKIGVFMSGDARVDVLDATGAKMQFAKSGWQHF
jgi:thiamine-monophosphate kinase